MDQKYLAVPRPYVVLGAGIAWGILSAGSLVEPCDYTAALGQLSDRDQLQSDWLRVGADFDTVMTREHAKASSQSE